MRSARCATLLQSVAEFVAAPPFASPDAQRPAADMVPTLVRRPLRRLRREGDRLGKTPDDAALHRVRILAKRLGYATDVSAPLAGKPAPPGGPRAESPTGRARRPQRRLRRHHRRRGRTEDATPSATWATGMLGGLQLARAADCRARFPAVYQTALARKRWTWIP